jgi:hypothetical protein
MDVYVGLLQGTVLHEDLNPVHGSRSVFVLVGEDTVVELAEPTGDGPLQADMAGFHQSLYALTFKVRDLGDAEQHLTAKGVKFAGAGDEATLVSDPSTTQGCVMGFTTWAIPGDPRPDWSAHTEGPVPARLFRRA